MTKALGAGRFFAVTAVAFSMAFLLVSSASAQGVPNVPPGPDPNIITVGMNPTACGGSVLCSTNGTTGYNGTHPFDLSTLSTWFQIGTAAQPATAGQFLVVNDTGATVTSVSITLNESFGIGTPSVGGCLGLETGMLCDNFQANQGAGAFAGNLETLSGPTIDSCTNGSSSGPDSCSSSAGQVAANFAPGAITFTWSGFSIGAGTTFDIGFASWNTPATPGGSTTKTPEPSEFALLGTGLLGLIGMARRKLTA